MIISISESALKEQTLSESLTEKFAKIFPTWPMMVATLIALALSILFLYFLAYKPIKKAIKARQEYIQNNIDSAKALKDQSQQQLDQANEKLAQAQNEASQIVQDGINRSNKIMMNYIAHARNTSKRMLEEARMDVAKQKEEFFEESKNQIAEVASELSKKILQSTVSPETEQAIIDEFLKEGQVN
ncbi:F0F1 ATP synthase subunit B [Mycoplasmopsis iners]|uniref:F0F1 ATP synthase subunit B n=1 Tax=Mycoplasmopsis iners TaxID=76630 RepID=UPI000495DA03|nr:F0F1 ATP synthase subunit B [Mycoplasmopsis iners]